MIQSWLEWLGSSPVGVFMAENPTAFPWTETVHVLAITLVVGVITIVDLRLVGLASRGYPVSSLTRALLPATWIAFLVAAVSGLLLFASNPITYFDNFYFRAKMLLLVAAGFNMLVFHVLTMRGIVRWDRETRLPAPVRVAGAVSLLLWIAIVACGRWIGFTMAPF